MRACGPKKRHAHRQEGARPNAHGGVPSAHVFRTWAIPPSTCAVGRRHRIDIGRRRTAQLATST